MLLPLCVLLLDPFLGLRKVEICTSKRHLPQHIRMVVERNNVHQVDFGQALELQGHL